MKTAVYEIIDKFKSTTNTLAELLAQAEWISLVDRYGWLESDFKVGDVITSQNKYDDGYSYTLTEEVGNFRKEGVFMPAFTPQQMLALGVFEGKYLNDDIFEFPKEWFITAKISLLAPDKLVNCLSGHDSRQGLSDWINNGWIKTDKKGWFQWYCRYYLGRRLGQEDEHQITRWRQFNRHAGQIRANCTPGDLTCRPRQRQALLQWAYDYKI